MANIAAFIAEYLVNINTDGDRLEQIEIVSMNKELISSHEDVSENMKTELDGSTGGPLDLNFEGRCFPT